MRMMSKGTMTTTAVTVNTTATALLVANVERETARIFNNSSATVYIGDANVTTAGGYPVPTNSEFNVLSVAAYYGVVASGTADVRVLEEG